MLFITACKPIVIQIYGRLFFKIIIFLFFNIFRGLKPFFLDYKQKEAIIMFKKLLNWLKNRKQVDTNLHKTLTQIQYSRLRDRAIEFCTKYDCINGSIELPPSHKIDTILPYMVRTKADLHRYSQRFPYRELVRRLDECYSF